MARKKQEEEAGGSWMDTYGDLVTLLLTFFVMLYSMSSMVEERWEKLALAFSRNGGEKVDQIVFTNDPNGEGEGMLHNNGESDDHGDGLLPGDTMGGEDSGAAMNTNLDELYESIKTFIEKSDMANSVMVMQTAELAAESGEGTEHGTGTGEEGETSGQDSETAEKNPEEGANNVYLQFKNNALFDPDRSVLRPESYEVLSFLGECLQSVKDDIAMIVIKGHTAQSANSDVDSRLLSAERAGTISNYFESKYKIPSTKLIAIGLAGDYPIADNSTEEGRQQNRRVEVVIISKSSALGKSAELLNVLGAAFSQGSANLDDLPDAQE